MNAALLALLFVLVVSGISGFRVGTENGPRGRRGAAHRFQVYSSSWGAQSPCQQADLHFSKRCGSFGPWRCQNTVPTQRLTESVVLYVSKKDYVDMNCLPLLSGVSAWHCGYIKILANCLPLSPQHETMPSARSCKQRTSSKLNRICGLLIVFVLWGSRLGIESLTGQCFCKVFNLCIVTRAAVHRSLLCPCPHCALWFVFWMFAPKAWLLLEALRATMQGVCFLSAFFQMTFGFCWCLVVNALRPLFLQETTCLIKALRTLCNKLKQAGHFKCTHARAGQGVWIISATVNGTHGVYISTQ